MWPAGGSTFQKTWFVPVFSSPEVRSPLRRMTEAALPHLAVLGYNEVVSEVRPEAIGLVGLNG